MVSFNAVYSEVDINRLNVLILNPTAPGVNLQMTNDGQSCRFNFLH